MGALGRVHRRYTDPKPPDRPVEPLYAKGGFDRESVQTRVTIHRSGVGEEVVEHEGPEDTQGLWADLGNGGRMKRNIL